VFTCCLRRSHHRVLSWSLSTGRCLTLCCRLLNSSHLMARLPPSRQVKTLV